MLLSSFIFHRILVLLYEQIQTAMHYSLHVGLSIGYFLVFNLFAHLRHFLVMI